MFTYFLQTQKEQYTKDVPLKPKKTINLYRWISVAAVAVLMFGIYTQVGSSSKSIEGQLNDEQLLAYNQTVEAFNLLSSNFNKSKDNINTLGLMSTSLDKGTENIAYLGEFSNTTNKIFKNK